MKWHAELKAEYKDIEVVHINDVKSAMHYRDRDKGKQRGIYVIGTKWYRGYDLKLAKDALVLVLAYEDGFPWSQVNQMFGRGSRSFGISRGYYFTWKFPTPAILKEQLVAKEKKYYDSHKLMKMLFESYPGMNFKKNATFLVDGFGKSEFWQTTIMLF